MKTNNTTFIIAIIMTYLLQGIMIANATPLLCEQKLAQAAVPRNAYFLPEHQALLLGRTLDKYKVVRLKPNGNYTKSPSITLKSNQALFGLAGTKLPKVFIPAGTTNAILSDVNPKALTFQGPAKYITRENCFNRINKTILETKNTILENNLFTDLSNVKIAIDNSRSGYLRNNLFIRTMVHRSSPSIKIIGDQNKQSAGNLFVWTNILTPAGDGIIIENQSDIAFIGLDAESWNWDKIAKYPAMMNVSNTDFLSVFMSNGGDAKAGIGRYFNLEAKDIILEGMSISRIQNPGIILGDQVRNFITIGTQNIGMDVHGLSTKIIELFNDKKPSVMENEKIIEPEELAASSKDALHDVTRTEKEIYNSWSKPQFSAIPDPAGKNWQTNLSSQPDSSGYIQSLIDKNGIAELNAGIYYISKPLKLKNGQGITGAGADKTAIIATSSDIDIITGADHLGGKTAVTTSFVLTDLTLQGGRNGVNHSDAGSGQAADYNKIFLSHVTFRNMKNTGILINNIYAWDNNFIDHVNFFNCKTGIKQIPDPSYIGGNKMGMTFLDKNVFYQCQFESNEIALDLQAKRANGLNALINCRFENNLKVIDQKNSLSTFFANSVFENNAGSPTFKSSHPIGFINSDFSTDKANTILFGDNTFCNNCVFQGILQNSSTIIQNNSRNSFFLNSQFERDFQMNIRDGLLLNHEFISNTTNSPLGMMFENNARLRF